MKKKIILILISLYVQSNAETLPPSPTAQTKGKLVKKQTLNIEKRSLKGSMNVVYKQKPSNARNIEELFTRGKYYGRFRSNTFYWDWSKETESLKNNKSMGIGGSLIYKTANLNGFAGTIGLYTSQNPDFFRMDKSDVGDLKAGKDTFSRNKVKLTDTYGMTVLAQAYLEYNKNKTNIKIGRQIYHSVFTKSNDTKMIPNTFDGFSIGTQSLLPKTKLRLAYFTAQKLRDHTSSHDVITFKDSSSNSWGNNDDSAIHKGLNYNNFLKANKDTEHSLTIIDLKNSSIKNAILTISYLDLSDILQDVVGELHYKVSFKNRWAFRPGFRYFLQKDNGGGKIAGDTNLKGKPAIGYDKSVRDERLLDSSLLAFRFDILMPNKKGLYRFGYSKIEDKADIVAPWRGFPTGGFTRAMAQYNWYANTETIMLRAVYNFSSSFNVSLRYAVQDFDDKKDNVQADSTIWHLDTIKKLSKNLEMKTRIGIINAQNDILKSDGSYKTDVSYNEYRLEFNYLF